MYDTIEEMLKRRGTNSMLPDISEDDPRALETVQLSPSNSR